MISPIKSVVEPPYDALVRTRCEIAFFPPFPRFIFKNFLRTFLYFRFFSALFMLLEVNKARSHWEKIFTMQQMISICGLYKELLLINLWEKLVRHKNRQLTEEET